jgi:predicted nucleic acid-binding protein
LSLLVDSDIVIEVLRAKDQAILAKWNALIASKVDVLFSPVTAAEIWEGARPQEHQAIALCFRLLACVKADYETGQLAGEFLRQYARSHGLEVPDALIAAAAVQCKAALWTRNRKHYPMPQLSFY